jgi:hypothetical protein
VVLVFQVRGKEKNISIGAKAKYKRTVGYFTFHDVFSITQKLSERAKRDERELQTVVGSMRIYADLCGSMRIYVMDCIRPM